MFLIPAHKSVDWKNPPVATVLLILINCFVFFVIQGDDTQKQYQALEFYGQSILPDAEFPAYVEYLEQNGRLTETSRLSPLLDKQRAAQLPVLFVMEQDNAFMRRLRNDEIITPVNPQFDQWHDDRERYDTLTARVVANSYGFKPAYPRPFTLLSHMFLHGGVDHLLGNMIVLFIVGFVVEAVVGRKTYLVSYLLGGLFAVGLYGLVHADSATPLVGASGAISALMGMYTVLFGLRKIRFFYSVLFYFGFMRAPAIILLPVWLANELYQFFGRGFSNIAYFAHIGGYLGGAGIAFLQKRFSGSVNFEFMEQEARQERDLNEYETGMQCMRELKLDDASKVFRSILKKDPKNRAALLQLYNIGKFKPASEEYHQLARAVIGLPGTDPATLKLVHQTFLDYLKSAKPAVRISYARYLELAMRFATGDYLDDAEKIITLLMRQQNNNNQLPRGVLAVAEALLRTKTFDKATHYLQYLMDNHPHSGEAEEARRLMKWAQSTQPSN